MTKTGPYTQEELDFIIENHGRLTKRQIADQLNRSFASVEGRITQLGIGKNHENKWSDDDLDWLRDNYRANYATPNIMVERLGRSLQAIRKKAKELGVSGIFNEDLIPWFKENYPKAVMSKGMKGFAADCGMTAASCHNWAKRLGVRESAPIVTKWTQEQDDMLAALVDNGLSPKDIAKDIGRNLSSVKNRIEQLGLSPDRNTYYRGWGYDSDMMLRAIFQPYYLNGDMDALSDIMGRSVQDISKRATELGLHNRDLQKKRFSISMKAVWRDPNHIRNTDEFRQRVSDKSTSDYLDGKILHRMHGKSWGKGGWYRGTWMRSTWETNYAAYLDHMISKGRVASWEYEPQTFEVSNGTRGSGRTYTPDFLVTMPDAVVEYHEVKGFMDQRSATKIELFRMLYPQHKLVVIDEEQYKKIAARSHRIPRWGEHHPTKEASIEAWTQQPDGPKSLAIKQL